MKGQLNKQLLPALKDFIGSESALSNQNLKGLKKENLVLMIEQHLRTKFPDSFN